MLNLHQHFLDALQQIAPGFDRKAYPKAKTPEDQAHEATELLRKHFVSHMIYVLDDAQIINGYENAETWLRNFVDNLPDFAHLIIVSRSTPNLPITEMIARNHVQGIGTELLRFTPEELNSLAKSLEVEPERVDQAGEVLDSLEGWPAGSVLALQPLPDSLADMLPAAGSRPEALFNALADSMLKAQAPQLRDFLLASSTLTRMTPELCSNILGYANSLTFFDQITKKNLFLARGIGGLTYHKLFRIFLQRRLHKEDPALFASFHLKAGLYFEEHRDLEAAFMHFVHADAPERARDIAERMAEVYFKQGLHHTLRDWYRKLESAQLPMPWLRYAVAMIHIDASDYPAAESELTLAEAHFEADEDDAALAKVRFQRAQIALREGRYDDTIKIARSLRKLPTNEDNLEGRALHMMGIASLFKGKSAAAAEHMEKASPMFRAYGDKYALSVLLQDLNLAYVYLGRTEEATYTLQEVVALRRQLGNPVHLAFALNNLGWHFHRHGLYTESISTLQEGLHLLAAVGNPRVEGYLQWTLADLLRDCQQFDAAERRYNRVLEIIEMTEPRLSANALVNFAIMRRWQDEPGSACNLAEVAQEMTKDMKAAPLRALIEAVLHAAETDLGGDALHALDEVLKLADALAAEHALMELVQVLVLATDIALLAEDDSAAREILNRAMEVANAGGGQQPLWAEALNNPRLNALIDQMGKQTQAIQRGRDRLADADLQPTARAVISTEPDVTYNLRVFTLGGESYERNGDPLPNTEWGAARSRELFLNLLFLGPLTREQIHLMFWPDKLFDEVRSNFHTTIQRIRNALGREAIQHENGFYLLNPDLDIWTDVAEMEDLTQQAQLLSRHTAYAEELWRAAVTLYQGDFLPMLDTDWARFRRRDLQERYFDALIELGGCLRVRDAIPEAISVYEQVLLEDPFREKPHREIMRCFHQRGEVGNILKQYRRLEILLREELQTTPSPETTALMYELTGGKPPRR